MIRNLDTYGAYSIRPYPDGRKGLFLRSIFDHEKQNNYFFDPKNIHAELIIPLFGSINCQMKRHDPFFDPKNGHAELIVHLFGSINCQVKRHDLLFESKKGYAKQQERFSERCFWGMFLRYLFRGIFFFIAKRKHSGLVVKIRSAKQKRSFWGGLFILAITHGRA